MDMEELNLTEEAPEAEEELSGVNYYEVIMDEFRDYIDEANDATVGLVISTARISNTVEGLSENVDEVSAIATDILESESALKKELTVSLDGLDRDVKEVDADVDDLVVKVKALEEKITALENKCAERSAVSFCAVAAAVAAIAAVLGLFF